MDDGELNKRLGECSTRLIEEIILMTQELTGGNAPQSEEYATFMMIVQRTATKGIVAFAAARKKHALKAADILHEQIVQSLNRLEWER